QSIADRIQVIDADTHISEPEDVWTSRVSKKWGELVPHVQFDADSKKDRWYMGGKRFMPTAAGALAGWKAAPPDHPPTLGEADPGSYQSAERLRRMDEYGIHAQVIYPNVGGFGSGNFLALKEPDLMYECVRAYNDFLAEWCSAATERLLPIMAMPFWDVDLCVTEMERAAKLGHKGVLMTNQPEVFDFPRIVDGHWNPMWEAAQEMELSINFHIGSGDLTQIRGVSVNNGRQAAYAKATVMIFLDNSKALMDVVLSGMCHRYPGLKFVSVESGIGWIPFLLEAMDWQWLNSGCREEHPEMELLPSEYFKRQCYGCFWFEEASAIDAIRTVGADHFLFETDFPHPTSLSPGPASVARTPKQHIDEVLGELSEPELRKVLHDNAAALYHVA
ncbi:MAG: amidohydrolase family protein, partial [Dehalococcoidia bacterium]